MRAVLNKFSKLLCYLIVSIFIFGIGGEIVKADSLTIDSKQWNIDYNPAIWNDYTAKYAKFNVSLNGTYRYAYCLDAPDTDPSGTLYSTSRADISEEQKNRIINVLVAAGYPQYNLPGIDNDMEAYYVTQAALWYARYGSTGTYQTFTPNFHLKMKNGTNGLGKYREAYNKLINAADEKNTYNVNSTQLSLSATNGNTMTETTINGNRVLVSDSEFSVIDSYSTQTNVRITVNGANASIYSSDLTQNYGTTKDLKVGTKFKIVIDVDDSAAPTEYEASFDVTELNPRQKYDLEFFAGVNSSGYQSLTLLVPKDSSPAQLSYRIKGNTTVHEYDVPFAKVDANGRYIDGARLEIYNSNNELIMNFDSVGEPIVKKLVPGDYYLKEIINPGGYAMNNTPVNFSIGNDGKITSGGEIVSVVSMIDEPAYITLKKVNKDGESISGATFIVYSKNTPKYICGKTDGDGYLTQTSPKCDSLGSQYGTDNLINSTGVYSLLDLDYTHAYSTNELYVKELEAAKGYLLDDNIYAIAGPFGNSIGWYYNHVDYMAGAAGEVISNVRDGKNVTEFQFKNVRFVDISKVDSIGGNELPGATLSIGIKNVNTGTIEKDKDGNSIYVDYWQSSNEPHKFMGIEKGKRYILEEQSSPDAYVKFSGMIEFELDNSGRVHTYDHSTGQELTTPDDLTVVMPNDATKTYISKTSAVTGEEIAGAHLMICTESNYLSAKDSTGKGENCDAIVEWDSEAGKEKQIDALEKGTYYLIETAAPAGYKMTNSVKFEVKNDGSLNQVEFKNEPIKVVISKKDQLTGKRLAGAKFEILKADDRSIASDFNGELRWTSTEDNDWEIIGLPKGDYILVETQNPEGFQNGMVISGELVNEYKFSVSDAISELDIDAYIEVLNAPNTGISTLNLFAIGGLMIFAGYETIKIYRRKALND